MRQIAVVHRTIVVNRLCFRVVVAVMFMLVMVGELRKQTFGFVGATVAVMCHVAVELQMADNMNLCGKLANAQRRNKKQPDDSL